VRYTLPLRRCLTHLLVLALFGVLAVAWSWPLATHLTTHLPGLSPGDNVGFLWNVWWFRRVLDRPELSFLYSDRLFAPYGFDLTLHTHAALPSLVAAMLAPAVPLSLIGAQNVVILAMLALNGWAAYLLAFDRTRHTGASLLAGVIFGASPFFFTRLLGHFNLLGAWGVPLFVLCLLRARERASLLAAGAAGVIAVLVAYTDYYYLTYCALLAAGVFMTAMSPFAVRWRRATPAVAVRATLSGLLIVDAIVCVVIVATGGFSGALAGVKVAANEITNPLAFAWLLLALLALAYRRPVLVRRDVARGGSRRLLAAAAVVLVVTAIGIAPLAVHGLSLWRAGDYAAPSGSWRSGPGGVDLATLVLGNPRHPLTGDVTRAAYERLHIDPMEESAWLGIAPLVLAALVVRRSPRDRESRIWLAITVCAFVWSLGPWLQLGGFNTGLLLPQNLAAHIPLISNARMPGRAMVIVYLGIAMLGAMAIARLPRSRQALALVAALAATTVDFIAAPVPLTQPRMPVLYADILAAGGDATVLEVPAGVRDGFGMIGRFDDLTLFYQIVHEHPIVGGFAARLPARIKQQYAEMPFVRSIFRLSQGLDPDPRDVAARLERTSSGALAAREQALQVLRDAHIGYVMVNRELAPPALVSFVTTRLPVILARSDGPRDLYVVTGAASQSAAPAR
jgi:hypothetical protein